MNETQRIAYITNQTISNRSRNKEQSKTKAASEIANSLEGVGLLILNK